MSSTSKSFQALLFDLGGVLYDIDIDPTVKAFESLGLRDFDKLYNLKEQTDLFDALETGKIGKQEFESSVAKHFSQMPEPGKIGEAWQALLIGMPEENITLLKNLRQYYRLYLLSNTNIYHLEFIDEQMRTGFGLAELRELFDKTYFSFEIGLRKPDLDYYEHVIRDASLRPENSLFIDDNEDNVKGARKAGLQAVQMKRGSDLRQVLTEAGVDIFPHVAH